MPTSETPIDQKRAIMQNKPNLLNAQMKVSSVLTKDYENKRLCRCVKTNPIQTQYKAKTNPIPEMSKMNVTSILTKDYENKPPSSPKKTKPIQTQSNPTCRGVASGEAGSNPIFKNSAPFLTGLDKSCQIMDNEAGIVHSPKLGRKIDAFACKTK